MSGIYIHIPYCKQRCYYCNFFTVVSLKSKNDFLKALIKEAGLQKNYFTDEEVDTIYFGGGTPSLLDISDLAAIIETLHHHFNICEKAEWTIEANPDDISSEYLNDLKRLGINRFSLGVQSFFDEDLRFLNRVHDSSQAEHSIRLIREAGFNNFSVDLIYGIPGLDRNRWKQNLEKVTSFNSPHISAYALTVEPKTPMKIMIEKGKLPEVSDKRTVEHLMMLMGWAQENAYEHYEISNFAQAGYRSKHNSSYWFNKKYLGLGPSAHSYNIETRQWNVARIGDYIKSIEGNTVPFEKEILTKDQKFNEYILTRLRTIEGVSLREINKNFGQSYSDELRKQIQPYLKSQYLILIDEQAKLTTQGIPIADQITISLIR